MASRYGRGSRRRFQGISVGQSFSVVIERVVDGCTVHVKSVERERDYRVRLCFIGAPDKSKLEPYWRDAIEHLVHLTVDREFIMEIRDFDVKNKMIIAFLRNEEMPLGSLSHEMLTAGWAFYVSGLVGVPELAELQASARSKRVGLWQELS